MFLRIRLVLYIAAAFILIDCSSAFADPVPNTGQVKLYATCQTGATWYPCTGGTVITGPTSVDPSTGNTVYAWSSGFADTQTQNGVTYTFDSVIDNNFAWYTTCPAGLVPNGNLQCSCPQGQQQDPFSGQCVTPPTCDPGYSLSWTSNGPYCASDDISDQSSSSSSLPPCSQVEPPYIAGSTCYDDSGSNSSAVSSQSASDSASSIASDSGVGSSSGSGDSGGGDSGGGSSSVGTGSNPDTCDLYPDSPLCASSSSSSGPDCPPGYDYYPGSYTCVPITSSSSSENYGISSSSLSSSSSFSFSSSSSYPSNQSSSTSSLYVDHNGETPISENDPCPNKYQDNQGQWWCINNSGSNSSGAASSSGGASAADCKAQPSCDGDPVQCAILKQVWINLCDGVDKVKLIDSDGDIKAMDDEFNRLINSEQLQLDEDGTLSSIKHTRIDLSKKEFGLDQLDAIANEGTSAQCPSPISLNLSLGSFEVSFQPLCDLADQLHYLVVFIFSYIASVIIYRAIERA